MKTATELTVLIPVATRPHRVRPVLKSIRDTTPVEYTVLFLFDSGDEEEFTAILDTDADYLGMRGNYAQKINAGVEMTQAPFLFFGADDLLFHPGWYEAAKAKLIGTIGVVGTNDLCNPMVMDGKLATHPLVSREYTKLGTIDDPDLVLHEEYPHEYVDREFTETAFKRNAYAYAEDSVVEHLHPSVDKAPMDAIYAQMKPRMRRGRRVYGRRRPLWM